MKVKIVKSELVLNEKNEIIGHNQTDENGVTTFKPFIYNYNPLMKMLGHQFAIYGGTKEFKEIQSIVQAYKECGDGMNELIATYITHFGCYSLVIEIFKYGEICGIRKERARRKKGD